MDSPYKFFVGIDIAARTASVAFARNEEAVSNYKLFLDQYNTTLATPDTRARLANLQN